MSEAFICIAACGKTGVTKENGTVKGTDKDGNPTRMICKECNSSKTRVRKLLRAHPSIDATDESTGGETLLKKCHGIYGDELVGVIRAHYRVTVTEENICQWKVDG